MKLVYLLIFTLLFNFSSFATDELDELLDGIIPKTSLSNEQLKLLREELRLQKMIIEEVQALRSMGVTVANLDTANSSRKIQEMLMRSFQARSSTVTGEISEAIKQGINKNNFRASLTKFKGFLKKSVTSKQQMGASLMRRFGMEVGLVYALGLQIDVVLPTIMISQGHLAYSVLLGLPVAGIITAKYIAIKKAIKFKHIVRALGGKAKAIAHYKSYFKIKKFFNEKIFAKTDLIDIKIGKGNFVLTATRENFITRSLSKLGYNKSLNYTNLLRVLENERLMEDFLYAVKGTAKPDNIKLLRILNRISLTQDEKVMSKIAEHFSADVKKIAGFTDFPDLKKWSIDIAHSTSIESFNKKLGAMPTNVPPKVFNRVWKSYIIPNASKSIRPFMSKSIAKSFTSMIDDYNSNLFREFTQSTDVEISPHLKKKFTNYLYNSLSKVGICGSLFRAKGSTRPLLIQY